MVPTWMPRLGASRSIRLTALFVAFLLRSLGTAV
jgi:hypothetical protein